MYLILEKLEFISTLLDFFSKLLLNGSTLLGVVNLKVEVYTKTDL